VSRLNDVTASQEYADQYGQGAELEKIYFMLRDISTTLAMFYDNIYNPEPYIAFEKGEECNDNNVDDMLKNWRFP
jgi:hypothetical protein